MIRERQACRVQERFGDVGDFIGSCMKIEFKERIVFMFDGRMTFAKHFERGLNW